MSEQNAELIDAAMRLDSAIEAYMTRSPIADELKLLEWIRVCQKGVRAALSKARGEKGS